MWHSKSPKNANRNRINATCLESDWDAARRAILALVRPQLTGNHWIQLSQQSEPLLDHKTSVAGSLWIETVDRNSGQKCQHEHARLTTFSSKSADGVICDQLIQSHPQPERIVRELRQLVCPGGWVLISGAGSMRGKQAAGVPTPCIRPQQIVTLLENNNFKLTQCYSHSSQPSQAAWQSHLERWRIGSQSQINAKLPSLLPLLCLRANTRPGWVMLFRDQTLGMTPLPSPLKSRRIKMQPNSAISLRALQQRQLADNKRNKSSTFTTRAA